MSCQWFLWTEYVTKTACGFRFPTGSVSRVSRPNRKQSSRLFEFLMSILDFFVKSLLEILQILDFIVAERINFE